MGRAGVTLREVSQPIRLGTVKQTAFDYAVPEKRQAPADIERPPLAPTGR